jgi:hypothetical protein
VKNPDNKYRITSYNGEAWYIRMFIYCILFPLLFSSCYKSDQFISGGTDLSISVCFQHTSNGNEKAGFITPDLKNSIISISTLSDEVIYSQSYTSTELRNGINILTPLPHGSHIIKLIAENTETAEIAGFLGFPEYDNSKSGNLFMKFHSEPDTITFDGSPQNIELIAKPQNTTCLFTIEPPMADFNSTNHKYKYIFQCQNISDDLVVEVNNLEPDKLTTLFSIETLFIETADSVSNNKSTIDYHGTLWYKEIKYHRWCLHNPYDKPISIEWEINKSEGISGCEGAYILDAETSCFWATPYQESNDKLKVKCHKSKNKSSGFETKNSTVNYRADNDTEYDSEAILINIWPKAMINSVDEEFIITGIIREHYIDSQLSSTVELIYKSEPISFDNPVVITSGILSNIKVSY